MSADASASGERLPPLPVEVLVERILAADGPLPACCEEQRRLGRIVAGALDAPPREGALVTLTQAATGTGKTIALLAPLMALAALQKKQGVRSNRAVLSTFTNHLARQIREDDAPKVNAALAALGYPILSVAPRVGRRQFIDPDRVDRAVRESRDRRDGADPRSLDSLELIAGFETFAEAEDHQMFVPAGFTTDDLCLTPRSGKTASAAFMARKRAAAEADLVLTNHALALTDCRYRGGVLGAGDVVSTVVFDEADMLPEVARSLADERIGLGLVADVVESAGAGAGDACRELVRLCAEETARDHRLLAHCASRPRIVELAGEVRDALGAADPPDGDAAEEAKLLRARLGYFLESAESGKAVAAVAAGATPALAVVHREPVRLLGHVFEKTEAAFFVSATLAAPSASPHPNDLLRAFGIAPGMKTPARINYAGWSDLQPRKYGRMRFRFADRSVPDPFRRGEDDSAEADPAQLEADPVHLGYVASAVEEARKSGRVLVLCTSYALAEELGSRVEAAIVHERGVRLSGCLDAFRAAPDGVLLTPAAWAGVSLPGMVDHLVIPRIPFRPPSVEDEARRGFLSRLGLARGAVEGLIAGDRNAAARRKLAQGIGRGIRGPDESCTLWLLDPRFPLPKSRARTIGGPGQGKAEGHLLFIHCIPPRFLNGRHPDVGQGEIWPLEPS